MTDHRSRALGQAVPALALGAYAAVYRSQGTGDATQATGNALLGLAAVAAVQANAKTPMDAGAFPWFTAACLVGIVASAMVFAQYNPQEGMASFTAKCESYDLDCRELRQVFHQAWPRQQEQEAALHRQKLAWVRAAAAVSAAVLLLSVCFRAGAPAAAGGAPSPQRGALVVAGYALALWVGWVHATTRRLAEDSLAVQMVETPGLQALFAPSAHRLEWVRSYALLGGVATVFALTRKSSHVLVTGLLYALVLGGFAVLTSLHSVCAMAQDLQPVVAVADPRSARETQAIDKGNVVVEGLGVMALALALLAYGSVMRPGGRRAGKAAEIFVLVVVFVLVLAFSDVSRYAQDSPHLRAAGLPPGALAALRQRAQAAVPAWLRPRRPSSAGRRGDGE